MKEPLNLFRRSLDEFGSRVHAVGAEQWGNRTPCDAWTVRDLVNHVVWAPSGTPPLLAGESVAEIGTRFDGDLLGESPAAAWALARSIGADDRLDDDLAVAVFNRYKSDRLYGGLAPGVGWSSMFKEPVDVAAEADPQSRLVAYVGRDPQLH